MLSSAVQLTFWLTLIPLMIRSCSFFESNNMQCEVIIFFLLIFMFIHSMWSPGTCSNEQKKIIDENWNFSNSCAEKYNFVKCNENYKCLICNCIFSMCKQYSFKALKFKTSGLFQTEMTPVAEYFYAFCDKIHWCIYFLQSNII